MTYFHIRWSGAGGNDPVELYSESDADHREVRKTEVFRDNRAGRASPSSAASARPGE